MRDEIYAVLGETIRQRRATIGMTQEALGHHLHLSRTSVTNIECGRQPLMVHQLYAAANALGVTPASLLPNNISAPIKADNLPEEISMLLRDLKPYKEDNRKVKKSGRT